VASPPIRRRRVVFMIDRLGTNRSGTENQLLKILAGLSRTEFDVHLICLGEHEWFREHRAELGCPTHVVLLNRFRSFATYVRFFSLIRLLKELNPDVVHTFFPVSNIVGVIAARLAGVRCVLSSRRDYGEWMVKRYLTATRVANLLVDRIVTNSPLVKQMTARVEGFDPERIDVIFNGIDLDEYQEKPRCLPLREELGIGPEQMVVGLLANFRPMKRHDTFMLAAEAVLAQRADVVFLLVGDDAVIRGMRRSYIDMAQSRGIAGGMRFVGSRSDVSRYLSIMDVGINCSEGEGLSNAVIEYMATGVPCVVSDSGGNPDLVEHDFNGAIFKLGDHNALATQIIRLLNNEDLRRRYSIKARERVRARFGLQAMLGNFGRYYRELISREGPAN
jgi:L-malate glycosyltransferase